ncbi:CDGSH iron-sulfur domain-containing protein [Patiriisocius hiemis]|uniref:CDGSH iron-sulfur domain-containing protein n=1 Tax=Patiriisocius hiemis TaxID=3075604 RepID=A0ABU2YEE8_9FLAO|nr:CDGSH iron-sulfur domain-containing protein [Constantimarinum sp. W242]MDT0556561.1 CDGSH iron-sulfur domain-containing protein [Constantimarinum sp. W242]
MKKETENTKVEVLENGPLMVHGSTTIVHTDGSTEEKQRATAFCRCGKTGNIPFCDGSHNS